MTALAVAPEPQPTLFGPETPSLLDAAGREPTLDDLLVGAWEGLTAHKSVACLICRESMTPDYGAHALPVGGSCRSCGVRLS